MATSTIEPRLANLYSARIRELAQRICEIYTDADLKHSLLNPKTFERWAKGTTTTPRRASVVASLPTVLGVTEQTINDYLDGRISLDALWGLRGKQINVLPTKIEETSFDNILFAAKSLNKKDRIELTLALVKTLDTEVEKAVASAIVELSKRQKKRLQSWFKISLMYRRLTAQQVVDAKTTSNPADLSLVTDLVRDFAGQYSRDRYESLLPFLCQVIEWQGDDLVIVSPANACNSFDEMMRELDAG